MKILIEHTRDKRDNRIAKSLDDAAGILNVPRSTIMFSLSNSDGKVILGEYLLTIL